MLEPRAFAKWNGYACFVTDARGRRWSIYLPPKEGFPRRRTRDGIPFAIGPLLWNLILPAA